MKPFEGAKQDGAKGFFKGLLQGVTGIVVKPVTGIFDATSKTAEGIKNTATQFDDCPNDKRERLPRCFYGREKYYKLYSVEDAQVLSFLARFKKGKYCGCNYLESVPILQKDQDKVPNLFLVLLTEYVLLINIPKKKRDWEVETMNLKEVELHDKGVKLICHKMTKKIPVS